MDDKNDKLEDFFNQSLNQFDDSPSDTVWEGLQQRLDSERTILEKWTSAVRKYFPYLLLLLGLGAYHYFAQTEINRLSNKLEKVHFEKLALDIKLSTCNYKTSTLISDLELNSQELVKKATIIAELEKNTKKASQLTAIKTKQKGEVKFNPTSISPSEYFTNTSTPPNTPIINSPFDSQKPLIQEKEKPGQIEEKISESPKKSSSTLNHAFTKPLYTRNTSAIATPLSIHYSNGWNQRINITDDNSSEKSKFRIGYEYKAFKTQTGTGKKFNFGNAHGLRMEYMFKNKFSLTGVIHFVDQQYIVTNSGNAVPVSDLQQYPGGVSFGDQVTALKVSSHYIDFPLGVKWQLKRFKNSSQLFVNPSLVWQFYLPQEFRYTINNSAEIDRKSNQYFGYFGSGNVQIGYEKLVRNNLVWQIALWGERSFAPLGIEDQNIAMIGLSTAVLFQQKN